MWTIVVSPRYLECETRMVVEIKSPKGTTAVALELGWSLAL